MDLSKPMISEKEINGLINLIESDFPDLNKELFIQLYNEDKIGGMIRNLENWLNNYTKVDYRWINPIESIVSKIKEIYEG